MIEAVMLDWGGVLMRTMDRQARHALAAQYGWRPDRLDEAVFGSRAWTRCQLGELSEAAFWVEWGRAHHLAPDRLDDFRRRFFAGDRLDDELVAFIRSVRPRLKTALLSNFSTHLRTLLAQHGLEDAFDVVILSSEHGLLKPDRRIYDLACRQLGLPPNQVVFVDDFVDNVRGAQQAGLHAVHFVSTPQTIGALKSILAARDQVT